MSDDQKVQIPERHQEFCRAVARIAPFKVIIGEEVRTREGEISGLFLKERIPPNLSARETVARRHDANGRSRLQRSGVCQGTRSSTLAHHAAQRGRARGGKQCARRPRFEERHQRLDHETVSKTRGRGHKKP